MPRQRRGAAESKLNVRLHMPNVRLQMDSRPESIPLVRVLLTGVAEAVVLGDRLLDDIKTAVTEACNNVVQHAYEDASGPVEVEIELLRDAIEVVVRDRGVGIRPWIRKGREPNALGLGLMVIEALAESVAFNDGDGHEIRMRFEAPDARPMRTQEHAVEATGERAGNRRAPPMRGSPLAGR